MEFIKADTVEELTSQQRIDKFIYTLNKKVTEGREVAKGIYHVSLTGDGLEELSDEEFEIAAKKAYEAGWFLDRDINMHGVIFYIITKI
jgi:hypothetical protein